jgi:hypothetical protein
MMEEWARKKIAQAVINLGDFFHVLFLSKFKITDRDIQVNGDQWAR